ncbi:hypothetical protein C1H46_035238 [Malus baccata]|uniref:Uncharacterized protein n=1 Tax=Malus baccata TaxID=106549 RepID=A0A540KYA7_MALBA|nr:hypothetical protein C1H46_035238 [Malus baccata]
MYVFNAKWLRLKEYSLASHRRLPRSPPHHRHHHRCYVRDRSRDGSSLAKRGAKLVLPARSLKATKDAKARIPSEFPGSDIIVMALDLSSPASVRSFASKFESLQLPLNLLINNAGNYGRLVREEANGSDHSGPIYHISFRLHNDVVVSVTQPAQSSVMRFRHQKAAVNDDDHLEQTLQRNPRDFNKLDNYMQQFKGSNSSIGAKKVKADCQQFREYCNVENVEGD